MGLSSIGQNIRHYRLDKKLRQEDLAEKAGVSINYIGSIERGEKLPALETFIDIINALGVSADMILSDVVEVGYTVKDSLLAEKLEKLDVEDRSKIYDVIDVMVKNSKQVKP
ncbi:MAG: helix-turn-helix transcriptional regulator [Clostridia bacterium]|nr:helix-turn-helix transcriptional regulator [Clostridia bacterium]